MPTLPIIDTHLHLWDPRRLSYAWLKGNPVLDQPYLVEDYRRACDGMDVAAMVFLECAVDAGASEQEVRFIEQAARRDTRIRGIVTQARLEQGYGALPFLLHLKETTPLLRGVRRIIESDPDPEFCLRPAFIEGINLLGSLGLSFEITANYRHMDALLRFVDRVGAVPMMLDHCAKPSIREGRLEPWASQLRTLAAARPDLKCKLSGLVTEADHREWTDDEIRIYIDAVVDAFGFERLVFGSDWPVCLQAVGLPRWIGLLDQAFAGVGPADLRRFWHDNAIEFYHLEP